ncbi:Gfo/Idh/MocA family protein [Rhodopirellula bahusiensis]|uniref:Oxidoreductase n=1 Tax=Rhodopirellula bahusiensis TaxID=2014065 RepID=A0A2G1WCN4_9BACT|nr:Gfo/Idh/MocA family oxidoreductase [Rhodopirellula bahusiensis]PHQ36756.1 hypothetical protein CEE69_05295 [Rhodopirellula bahusiensis]
MILKLAIVGCGAIAEQGHLPGAMHSSEVAVTLLVDKQHERTKKLSEQFNVANTSDQLADVLKFADAAVVATPPGSHNSITCQLLEMGIPVLLEKPIALTAAECQEMVDFANKTKVLLAAGMTRRLFRSDLLLRDLIKDELLGDLISFSIENGYDYAWPSASNFILSKEQAGGGVLMGLGSHVLDSLIWMLGDPVAHEYWCDAEGGIESECRVDLEMQCGAKGSVELSRSRNLENRFLFEFEKGRLVAPFYGDNITLSLTSGALVLKGRSVPMSNPEAQVQSMAEIMAEELDDFAHAIRTGEPPMATAADAMRSIRLIEQCYSSPKLFNFPWMAAIGGGK